MPSLGRLTYLDALPPASAAPRGGRGHETLVLIHGFPLSARMWEPQLTLAEVGWRVVVPELRGFGAAQPQPLVQSVDDYAGDIIDLLDGLRIEDAVIGGLSMGGYVAFALFRLAPRYFRGMVLADTRPQADTVEGLEARRRTLGLLREKGPSAVAEEMLPKLLGETTRRERQGVVDLVRSIMQENSSEAIEGAIHALMSRPDSTPLLSSVHCPTLIVVGEEDTLTPPALSEAMHAAIAGSELQRISRAGHMPNLEQPEVFNSLMRHFLGRRV